MTILRAGEVLEPALMSVCKDVMIGKILIQTNDQTENPEVNHVNITHTYIHVYAYYNQ